MLSTKCVSNGLAMCCSRMTTSSTAAATVATERRRLLCTTVPSYRIRLNRDDNNYDRQQLSHHIQQRQSNRKFVSYTTTTTMQQEALEVEITSSSNTFPTLERFDNKSINITINTATSADPVASSNVIDTTSNNNNNKKKMMTSRRREIAENKDPIIVTNRAAERICELLSSETAINMNAIGIRLGVKRRGCNGLSYTLNYATNETAGIDTSNPDDNNNNNNNNSNNASTTSSLDGTTTTTPTSKQQQSKKKGNSTSSRLSSQKDIVVNVPSHNIQVYVDPMALFNVVGTVMDYIETDMGSEFTFENPNSKGSCGCGESFNV